MLRAFNNWFNTKHQVGEFDGVKFASASDTEGFASLMSNALERIKTADALRYSRVLRNVEWIIDVAHPNGANHGLYVWKLRRFQFDFDFERDDESLDNLTSYVALCLVHESTFGVLCSRGILKKTLRDKKMAICIREEQRFLRNLGRKFPGVVSLFTRSSPAPPSGNALLASQAKRIIERTGG